MIPFYRNPLNPHVGCIQVAITMAVVTENVHMSMCWEAQLVAYRSLKQSSA
jgi:hypothetical protein